MMKKLAALFFIFTALNVYADDNIDVEFTGTLAAPTCSASFESNNGADIHFDTLRYGDIYEDQNGTVITTGTPVSAFIRLAGCGSNVANVILDFTAGKVSGYGFSGKAVYFQWVDDQSNASLGVALFRNSTGQTVDDAISFQANNPESAQLTDLINDNGDYKFPLYARIVMANTNNERITGQMTGDLTATAQVAVSYE